MPSTRELKLRINSVSDTKKITNAMYLIASTKMKKAKENLVNTYPYFTAIRREIKRILRTVKEADSKYFYPVNYEETNKGTYGIVIITSDKGLAGAYNSNVIKEALKLINDHDDYKLFVIGNYGKNYFSRHGYEIEDFDYSPEDPTIDEARDITAELLDKYDKGKISKLFIIYSNLINSFSVETMSMRILPFHRHYFDDKKADEEKVIKNRIEFYPSLNEVIDSLIESYVAGIFYGALVDSFSSEENSRMNAMSTANKNADELIEDLSREYNKIRQMKITEEIIEISAGAKALKKE